MEGTKKIKSMSFHQYSWNSEVETTWISLIGWHHKTSNIHCTVHDITIFTKNQILNLEFVTNFFWPIRTSLTSLLCYFVIIVFVRKNTIPLYSQSGYEICKNSEFVFSSKYVVSRSNTRIQFASYGKFTLKIKDRNLAKLLKS